MANAPHSTAPLPALRNYAAWQSVFWASKTKFGEICTFRRQEDGCGSMPPGRDLGLREGVVVAIKPNGTRRDDIELEETEWLAWVVEIRRHEDYGPILRLRWLYSKAELVAMPVLRAGNILSTMVVGMGQMERFAGHETFEFGDAVDRVVPVAVYSTNSISLKILGPTSIYMRSEILLEQEIGARKIACIEETVQQICRGDDDCIYGRQYRPDDDVVRWCQNCKIWYHTECLDLAEEGTKVTLEQCDDNRPAQGDVPEEVDDIDFMDGAKYTSYEYSIWRRLLFQPIQRGYAGFKYPMSFEVLLNLVRDYDRIGGCPNNVRTWLQAEMSLNGDAEAHLQKYWGYLINLPAKPEVYMCARCGWSI